MDVHNIESLHRTVTPVSLYGTTTASRFYAGEWALLAEFLKAEEPEALVGVVRWDGHTDLALRPLGVSAGWSSSWNWEYSNPAYPASRPSSFPSFDAASIILPSSLSFRWESRRRELASRAIQVAQAEHQDECSYGNWAAHVDPYGRSYTVTFERQREDGGPRFAYWQYTLTQVAATA